MASVDGSGSSNTTPDVRGQRVARSAGVLGAGLVVGRVLGLLRDVLIAAALGTSGVADAWLVAFRIPNLLGYQLATGAFNPAIVPVFNSYLESGSEPAARRLGNTVLALVTFVLVALCLVGWFGSEWIVRITAPGFVGDPAKVALSAQLMAWCFIYLVLVGASAVMIAILQSLGSFRSSALAPIAMNVMMIAAIVFVCPQFGEAQDRWVWGLVVGVLASGTAQVLLHVPALWRRGYLRPSEIRFAEPGVRRVGRLLPATLASVGVSQATIFVNTLLATLLGDGAIAALEYGVRAVQFPYLVLSSAILAAVTPPLARAWAKGDVDDFDRMLRRTARFVLFVLAPVAVLFAVASRDIVGVLYERGSFTASSGDVTAFALACYAAIMVGDGLLRLFVAAAFARSNPRSSVWAAGVTLVANIALAIPLMRVWGVGGLALAAALAPIAGVVVILPRVSQRGVRILGGVKLAKIVVASAVAAAAAIGALSVCPPANPDALLVSRLGRLAAAAAAAGGAYVLSAWLLRTEELREVRTLLPFRTGPT